MQCIKFEISSDLFFFYVIAILHSLLFSFFLRRSKIASYDECGEIAELNFPREFRMGNRPQFRCLW